MKLSIIFILVFLLFEPARSQQVNGDSAQAYSRVAQSIFEKSLRDSYSHALLLELTDIGPRLSGSAQAASAVEWAERAMRHLGFDNVRLEPVKVPRWVRGDVEEARPVFSRGANGSISSDSTYSICALGGSIGTGEDGIMAEVLEVRTFDELHSLNEQAAGKIIFFNRPMDRSKLTTFEAYGGAVNQRGSGAIEAAAVGGVAALVRSMTTRIDDIPHTGAMHYTDSIPKVPAAAISTMDADALSAALQKDPGMKLWMKLSCETLPDVESANVVGEIIGWEKPDEVVVIGGHLDSWDKGTGAHDDGAGCVQSIDALRLIKESGLKPRRTIRAVMFMNEENGLRGGIAYAAKDRGNEKHIAAIESDAGGFAPRGFGVSSDSVSFEKIRKWEFLFADIEADRIRKGGGGADISPLAQKGVPAIGLRVDSHRYFDYHHSATDTFDKVNERELALGAAAMAILSYVLAEEGL